MTADPRWLEILKASGWQTTALTAAAALTLYVNAKKRFPAPLDSWVIETAEVSFLVFGCLSLASIGSFIVKASSGPRAKLAHLRAIHRAKHEVEKDIPSMTTKEREIIGYLLTKNQKMFTYTADGGHAHTLVSKRFVVCALLQGQPYTTYGVPFKVPEHVWDVLTKHRADFPAPAIAEESQPYPWAVHWMER